MSAEYYQSIEQEIESYGFTIVAKDFERPWGAFFVIKEEQALDFANRFFDGIDVNTLRVEGKVSSKILIVKPGERISWQYHHRRAEIWQVYKGEVGIVRSNNDTEGELVKFKEGEQVRLAQGERHRLIGLEDYGIVAEIWQHTDVVPSDEEDIVRVQDDFKRNKMKKKAVIVSGYFNPIHKGHLEYFNNAKALADELFVIVNNDYQRALKGSKEFQKEDERMIIVSNIKAVDKAILSIDKDRTVCSTLKMIAEKYGGEFELAFANGGDQINDTIPERTICEEIGITLIDGLGDKIQSSSWLLK